MKRFAALLAALEATTSTRARTDALARYFRDAPPADRMQAIALISGRRPRRAVTAARLGQWAAETAGLPDWLFAESYAATGDLAETIALILPPPETAPETPPETPRPLTHWAALVADLAALPDESARRAAIENAWAGLSVPERFLFNKLLTGGLRIGVAEGLLRRALAQVTGLPPEVIAHRLMAGGPADWDALCAPEDAAARDARPYPFCLAHPLDGAPADLGAPGDFLAEWKWDGIRAQIVARGGALHLWSRGEDPLAAQFPDLLAPLPEGIVLDGEIVPWRPGAERPLPFAALQRRLGRKAPGRKLLSDVPVRFLAYDLLECDGRDLRDRPLTERRARLEALAPALPHPLSPTVAATGWEGLARARAEARAQGAEGLMLKHRDSAYGVGRKRGAWWKWKLDPMVLDAVLVYAQAGHGRRAGLYTDFTFALWQGDALVPVARAYSGLSDAEFAEISAWVRAHTRDRFGPVRQVQPELVFEIGFEGIAPSPRHKSGIALRFPRMLRWRRDKTAAQADRIETARALMAALAGD
ncbi:ATP-dependent DNA ligase [Phaeovulum vinaykumarii]|uniref:DNA ligase (ATP) n=1 Tax=Phaeovulum vinaykumarii TaxID=407234 RepID=A0A1N7MHA5_9RHOB|nr:ATP-dependent DNA ligase [Phaeovulum vinaykumarii]SIS85495.1 DNA ligase-1 [Phaeovulum vinaykumarii]SOC12255.1 DNA ligase-1 [Phaeovulum vinaykumarii]